MFLSSSTPDVIAIELFTTSAMEPSADRADEGGKSHDGCKNVLSLNGGILVQLLAEKRCETCQTAALKCVIEESADKCLTCLGSSRSCVFSRQITILGSRPSFQWSWIVDEDILTWDTRKHRVEG